MPDTLYKLEMIVPDVETAEAFTPAVDPFCFAAALFEVTNGGPWRLEAWCDGKPDHDAVLGALALAALTSGFREPAFTCVRMPDTDWLSENLKSFKPFRAGRFFVYPSIHEGSPPPGSWPILMDAGMAFGTGEHATTHGCLLILMELRKQTGRLGRALDLGCGSGILAIGMARAWPGLPVDASDIDPVSVTVARENFQKNRVAGQIRAVVGTGFSHRALNRRYDLIVANILANPICAMAREMRRHSNPGGRLVLSGLLPEQEARVLSAYRMQGFTLRRRLVRSGWLTLLLSRRV